MNMKKNYTGEGEPKKIWDAVYGRVKAKNLGARSAVGETSDCGFIFHSYDRLLSDAIGLAIVLSDITDPSDPITVGAGAIDTALVVLAASLVSRSVIISDRSDSLTFGGVIITDKRTHFPRFISPEELRPLIAGALSGNPSISPHSDGKEIEITFRSGGGSVSYSEGSALLAALAFKSGASLTPRDRLMSLILPTTEGGFLCGVLAPLLTGASTAVCADAKSTIRYMRSLSPSKLFCPGEVANALLLKLLRIKKRYPRVSSKSPSLSFQPSLAWFNRLFHPRIAFLLGGRLKTVISTDQLSPISSRALFSFGIYSISTRSVKGLTPALFHYGEDPRGVWKLPLGAEAELCNVRKGGVGSIVISAPYVRLGSVIRNTYLANEKPDGSSIVTPFLGFIFKNGNIFVSGK